MMLNRNTTQAINRALVNNPALPMRRLKLHEYQAGALLSSFQVPIPLGDVARTPEEAFKIAEKLPQGCVVKSQVLGGGRGLGHFKETGFKGGVHLVDSAQKAQEMAF